MTTQKVFKGRVRTRMAKTGESYTAARRQLLDKATGDAADPLVADEPSPAVAEPSPAVAEPAPSAAAVEPPVSDAAILRASGRGWDEWFGLLDDWGATDRRHPEIARWLVGEHGVDGWWSQSITVAYERARGMRLRHQMAGGFSVAVTRTIEADADRLLAAFTDASILAGWLPGIDIRRRPTTAADTARFDWPEPPSRLIVGVIRKGPGKTTVAVAHEKLPDAESADRQKAAWRDRLAALKAAVEDA